MMNMKVGRLLCVLAVLAAIVSITVVTVATTVSARTMVVHETGGTVTYTKGAAKEYTAKKGTKLSGGYTLSTSTGSYAYISLDDESLVKLDQKTKISVSKQSSTKLSLSVLSGSLSVSAGKQKDGEVLAISGGNAALTVRGTLFVVEYKDDGNFVVYMLSGSGEVFGHVVDAGFKMTVSDLGSLAAGSTDPSDDKEYELTPLVIDEGLSIFMLEAIVEYKDELIERGELDEGDLPLIAQLLEDKYAAREAAGEDGPADIRNEIIYFGDESGGAGGIANGTKFYSAAELPGGTAKYYNGQSGYGEEITSPSPGGYIYRTAKPAGWYSVPNIDAAIIWTINLSGLLEIDGIGEIPGGLWGDMKQSIKAVRIYSGVTSIGSYAFDRCINLASVEIPRGVTSIKTFAFRGCALDNVTIPDSVTAIGDYAFFGCRNMTSVLFNGAPPSYLGERVFYADASIGGVSGSDGGGGRIGHLTGDGGGAGGSIKSVSISHSFDGYNITETTGGGFPVFVPAGGSAPVETVTFRATAEGSIEFDCNIDNAYKVINSIVIGSEVYSIEFAYQFTDTPNPIILSANNTVSFSGGGTASMNPGGPGAVSINGFFESIADYDSVIVYSNEYTVRFGYAISNNSNTYFVAQDLNTTINDTVFSLTSAPAPSIPDSLTVESYIANPETIKCSNYVFEIDYAYSDISEPPLPPEPSQPQPTYMIQYDPGAHGTFAAATYYDVYYGDATPAPPSVISGEAGWTFAGWSPSVASTVTVSVVYVAQWVQTTSPNPPPPSPSPSPAYTQVTIYYTSRYASEWEGIKNTWPWSAYTILPGPSQA